MSRVLPSCRCEKHCNRSCYSGGAPRMEKGGRRHACCVLSVRSPGRIRLLTLCSRNVQSSCLHHRQSHNEHIAAGLDEPGRGRYMMITALFPSTSRPASACRFGLLFTDLMVLINFVPEPSVVSVFVFFCLDCSVSRDRVGYWRNLMLVLFHLQQMILGGM